MSSTKSMTQPQPRLKSLYNNELKQQLKTELELKNINQVPKLQKIVLNVGLGKAKDDKKAMEIATTTLTKISGQSPIKTSAKVSVAGLCMNF